MRELKLDGTINIWFWERNSVPSELNNNKLDTLSWNNTATEKINYKKCPNTFAKMRMIINTTVCGDAFGKPGRQKCDTDDLWNNKVKYDTYIENASWKINSISVYQLE
jgi:hypothetical protein